MCMRVGYKEKYEEKNNVFCILKVTQESYGSADPDPHENVTDPQHWVPGNSLN
jgi:hypothetical protein